jgi:alkanesulfonate monooxygenase SsuD/methylene tetrahydromethanopterin reductase-like flavin-dependent oxidoreductase (luciferase family)
VYRNELRLGDLAEPLGFDSLWGVEHHFTDYTMCPDVLQYLTYFAGRTERIQLGSMVVVLPWHDPLRVAEQVIMLDHMSNGRFILGIGRGLGRVEFEGFGVNQEDSRAIFVESAQLLLSALEKGVAEYSGKLHPAGAPRAAAASVQSFRGRTYAAAVSPESSEIMAKLGIGILIIPQKPWDMVVKELNDYRSVFSAVNGIDAPPPIVAGWTLCDANADRAEEHARKYIGEYYQSVIRHYELIGDHLTKMRGYEAYKAGAGAHQRGRRRRERGVLPRTPGLGNARALLPEDRRHDRADRRRGVQRRFQLRRHALRDCRGEPAAIRFGGDARARALCAARRPAALARPRRATREPKRFRLPPS